MAGLLARSANVMVLHGESHVRKGCMGENEGCWATVLDVCGKGENERKKWGPLGLEPNNIDWNKDNKRK